MRPLVSPGCTGLHWRLAGLHCSMLTYCSTASLSNGLSYQLILLSTEWVLDLDFPTGQYCMLTL